MEFVWLTVGPAVHVGHDAEQGADWWAVDDAGVRRRLPCARLAVFDNSAAVSGSGRTWMPVR